MLMALLIVVWPLAVAFVQYAVVGILSVAVVVVVGVDQWNNVVAVVVVDDDVVVYGVGPENESDILMMRKIFEKRFHRIKFLDTLSVSEKRGLLNEDDKILYEKFFKPLNQLECFS